MAIAITGSKNSTLLDNNIKSGCLWNIDEIWESELKNVDQ